MKLGLIRCLQTEDNCSGRHCLESIANQEGAFKDIEEKIDLTAMVTCGGCPASKVKSRINAIIDDVDAIALASCIKLGTPIGYPCPHVATIEESINQVDNKVIFFDWTHSSKWLEILWGRVKSNNLDKIFKKGMKV
ncbi:putative metal-binding protein [Halobacteroides halobius DSM 5150]|uniref:Putative metal-binding protein n=1 Tax=Halobacteroides halobius (strain ATCC 35273 / DSM 5150 / MD-1) TaxID=748449 RepID=L0K7X1_HALHC|nr:CGGC domain-containing protein [Halobacteroides halobius]AGB41121.1 putative metal-binding protein [Halobacteroides halobius DSM 5150]